MKKLSKIKLRDAVALSDSEMKNVKGGYDENTCAFPEILYNVECPGVTGVICARTVEEARERARPMCAGHPSTTGSDSYNY